MLMLELFNLDTFNPVSAAIVFIYGALIGSFLNVVIYRLPNERSVVSPCSACGTCGTPLSWWENIPILSYFLLRGKCHTCGSTFSWRYAGIETLSALMAVALLQLCGGVSWQYVYWFIFFAYLCVVFFMDFDNWIIMDSVSLSGTAVGIIGSVLIPARPDFAYFPEVWQNNLASSLAGAAAGAALFWSIQFIGSLLMRQEALGSGDIKLAALIGAFLGWQAGLLALMLSFILGAFTVPAIMLIQRKGARVPVPLGTFMACASMLVVFYGARILHVLIYWPMYY